MYKKLKKIQEKIDVIEAKAGKLEARLDVMEGKNKKEITF